MVRNDGLYCVAGGTAQFDCLAREAGQKIGQAGVKPSVNYQVRACVAIKKRKIKKNAHEFLKVHLLK